MNQNRNNNNNLGESVLDDIVRVKKILTKEGVPPFHLRSRLLELYGGNHKEIINSLTENSFDFLLPGEKTEIRQPHVNANKEREKTKNALYSRVKKTSEFNNVLHPQPDSCLILTQQTQTGQGKTAIINQFWKKASFDATVSELIQQSSRLVIGANEFIYDRATFVNQSKVRSALSLIKEIDNFIARLYEILNHSPIDNQPLSNISEFPQYAAMTELRCELVGAFCQRVATMYGKPRERADRLILEMSPNYKKELTEKINSHL